MVRFHMARSTTAVESEHNREHVYGWSEGPPGNGLMEARPQWVDGHSGYQSHHQSPIHEHNGYVYNSLQEPPMYAASMPPHRTTYPQLQPHVTSPQLPDWPSQLRSQPSNHFPPAYSLTSHVSSAPLSAPAPPTRGSGRSGSNPRKTLTDVDRRNMCIYAEEHPTTKQTEIGGEC